MSVWLFKKNEVNMGLELIIVYASNVFREAREA